MKNKFAQHIYTSTKSRGNRGGFHTFQISDEIKPIENELIEIGKHFKESHTPEEEKNIDDIPKTLAYLKIGNNRIYAQSIYLGNEIHSSYKRPGNYIAHSLVLNTNTMANIFNPIALFDNFDWKRFLSENEDTRGTPDRIMPIDIETQNIGSIKKESEYFDFLREYPRKISLFAMIMDAILLNIPFVSDPNKKNKILIVDEEEFLTDWAYAILLCFPDTLADKLTFAVNINKQVPNFCNLLFASFEQKAKINPDFLERNIMVTSESNAAAYNPQFKFTKELVLAIQNEKIISFINDFKGHFEDFPFNEFSKDNFNRVIEYFEFFKKDFEGNYADFENFIQKQISFKSSERQLKIIDKIFYHIYETKVDLDLTFALTNTLLKHLPFGGLKSIIERYYLPNEFLLKEKFLDFINLMKLTINDALELFDLFNKHNIKGANDYIIAIARAFLNKLTFSEVVDDKGDLIKIGAYITNKELKQEYDFWLDISEKFNGDSILNWKNLTVITADRLFSKIDVAETQKYLEHLNVKIQQVNLINATEEVNKDYILAVYDFLEKQDFISTMKLPKHKIIKAIFDLNKNNHKQFIDEFKNFEPKERNEILKVKKIGSDVNLLKKLIPIHLTNSVELLRLLEWWNNERISRLEIIKLFVQFLGDNKNKICFDILKEFNLGGEKHDLIGIDGLKLIFDNVLEYKLNVESSLKESIETELNAPIKSSQKIILEDIEIAFKTLLRIEPEFSRNPEYILKEDEKALQSIANLSEFILLLRKSGNKLNNESRLDEFLENAVRKGWTRNYWHCLLEKLEEQKVEERHYKRIHRFIDKEVRNESFQSYLLTELLIACIIHNHKECLEALLKESLEFNEEVLEFTLSNQIQMDGNELWYKLQRKMRKFLGIFRI